MNTNDKERAVMVTTAHKGVFFGYMTNYEPGDETITLLRVRLCVHWSQDVRGFLGLAANGPSRTCKIGPPTPRVELRAITSVAEVTQEAAKKWEQAPWG